MLSIGDSFDKIGYQEHTFPTADDDIRVADQEDRDHDPQL
jgi:hypothetical protein